MKSGHRNHFSRTAYRSGRYVNRVLAALALMITISTTTAWALEEQAVNTAQVRTERKPAREKRPLSYWLKSLRTRDSQMDLAFNAIIDLGPAAWLAVEDLTKLVDEPFTPIRIGVDRQDLIAAAILKIHIRGEAVDALTAIGQAAASSTEPLIHWALTVRVIPVSLDDLQSRQQFIDLIAMDVLERMRVAGAVAHFGADAVPAVAALLKSADDEKRKFAVAILSENALPIAARLLKSMNCEDRRRGFAILADMWPVMPQIHLTELKSMLRCDAN